MRTSARILVVHPDSDFAGRLVASLGERGCAARTVATLAAALTEETPDLLVCASALDDGNALELLAALRQRTGSCEAVLTAEVASVPECTAAMRAGVREFFVQPFSLGELVEAVERLAPKPALPSARSRSRLRLCLIAEVENNARAVRELLAFLVIHGFAGATRARIAGAVAELLENVARHAYPDADGRFTLDATLDGRRLQVEITDEGVGCVASRLAVAPADGSIASGLSRAGALAEGFSVSNRPAGGVRALLEFASTSCHFGDERGIDLSDLDYLDPAMARRVLWSLRDGSAEPQFHLSPALAVCVGRLLSAPRPARSRAAELWS